MFRAEFAVTLARNRHVGDYSPQVGQHPVTARHATLPPNAHPGLLAEPDMYWETRLSPGVRPRLRSGWLGSWPHSGASLREKLSSPYQGLQPRIHIARITQAAAPPTKARMPRGVCGRWR